MDKLTPTQRDKVDTYITTVATLKRLNENLDQLREELWAEIGTGEFELEPGKVVVLKSVKQPMCGYTRSIRMSKKRMSKK